MNNFEELRYAHRKAKNSRMVNRSMQSACFMLKKMQINEIAALLGTPMLRRLSISC